MSSFPDTAEMKMLCFVFFLNIMIVRGVHVFNLTHLLRFIFCSSQRISIFLHVNVQLTALFNYTHTAICVYYWAQSDLFRLCHLLGAHEEAEDEFHLKNTL